MSQSLGCMQLNEKNHVPFLTFPRLDALPYITHAFSTRKGGVSQQEFSSMNLNFNRGDSRVRARPSYGGTPCYFQRGGNRHLAS